MIVLTTWASANIISGGAYFITKSPEEKYFYGMNSAWGAVNLAIAIPSLLSKKPKYPSKFKQLEDQIKIEKVFLINAGLDLVYITGGFTLKELAKNQTDTNKKAMLSGFGLGALGIHEPFNSSWSRQASLSSAESGLYSARVLARITARS